MNDSNLKVVIFFGHKKVFDEQISEIGEYKTLSEIVVDFDCQRNKVEMVFEKTSNLVIFSDEYGSVNESVVQNFMMFVKLYQVDNLYIQNPPIKLVKNIKRFVPIEDIEEINYSYGVITLDKIKDFKIRAEEQIIGQNLAIKQVTKSMLSSVKFNKTAKPLVLMFYGPSGVGKTETSKILSAVLNNDCELFIKPFGMYQNNNNINSLYGEKLNEESFAKELLDRESNVILIDEFDKANHTCFSAFYQLFDEGIYIDKNYKVNLKNSIIICTSNYKDLDDIKKNLGDPIYYRFDAFIKFNELSLENKKLLMERKFDKYLSELDENDKKVIESNNTKDILVKHVSDIPNVRKIDTIIKDTMSLLLLDNLINENK